MINMKIKQLNWFAMAGGILLLLLIPISIYISWWKLIVGENLLAVNASPTNTNINLLGTPLSPPLIWAMNITGILTFLACGIIMLIYSIIPTKSYSQDLLSFGYRKPLYVVILYIVGLLIITVALQSFLGIDVPTVGTSTLALPTNLTSGVSISVMLTSAFQWPFLLGIFAAALCIIARVYHKFLPKLSSNSER